MFTKSGSNRRTLVLGVVVLVLGIMATAALADDLVQPDQRVNQVVYFGGEALYCVDGDFEPTTNYGEMVTGGFRVLDESGQELLFVPYSDVAAAVSESQALAQGVEVASGQGTYGPAALYAYSEAAFPDTVTFTYTGTNQWGTQESLTFTNCFPEGPDVPDETEEI